MEVAAIGAEAAGSHSDCQPIPRDVQEELQRGPRGADGQPIRKLIDYFSSSSPHFQIEMRPNKRIQPTDKNLSEATENNAPGSKRITGEESWTKIKPVQMDAKMARAMKENQGADSRDEKKTELNEVKMLNPSVFIGMDVVKRRPVITDKNPHVEGLQDAHKCIYLPSTMDKNQYLPQYLNQNVIFMELPSAPLYTPGIAPGLFFVTPKLAGCNIFVAHDPDIHKYWVLRISSKNPYLPPDLEKMMAEEDEAKKGEGGKEEVKRPNTLEKITAIKEKLIRVHSKVEKLNLEMELESLQIQYEGERTSEINVKLASGIPRYGPEAAALRDELEKIKQGEEKRKTAKDEELKKKADKLKTNKARDSPMKESKNSEKAKTKSSENLAPKTETQIKLDKLKAKKKMIEDAEKEKHKVHAGRHTNCMGEAVQQFNGVPSFGKPGSRGGTATSWSRTGKKNAQDEFGGMGATSKRDTWRPPKGIKKHKCEDKTTKKKSWAVQFKEFRQFAESVLDYLRSQGMNAHFVLRIATDRDWAADVRAQSFWLEETNRVGKCNHYMYRGEAVFFARFDEGNWKFGLKDLAISSGKTGIATKYPLEGKDYFHASNCDTHNAYHQAMSKGAKMLEKGRERKQQDASEAAAASGMNISTATSEISGVAK